MRRKNPNSESRQNILIEGFKLFAAKSLNAITFTDLENATGLSRGAILYHFKTKDQIFAAVVQQFVIDKEEDLPTIDVEKELWENIEAFVNLKRRQQENFTNIGITNINRAFIFIAANAMVFSKDLQEGMMIRREREVEYWNKMLQIAIKKREITKVIDESLEAQLFLDVYYGYSYTCMATPTGYDLDYLLTKFRQLYTKLVTN